MRRDRSYQRALFVLLVLVAGVLYFARLGSSPPYLSIEEVGTARQSYSLATTGRDLTGRWLPLYAGEPGYEAGRDPLTVYAQAALLRLAPFSETLVRLPSAMMGVLSVVVMFFVARHVFGDAALALFAAACLTLTPAHFIQSRIASQQIGPVLFELIWLLFFARYLEARRWPDLFLAGAALGVGTYAYLPAFIMLPIYFTVMIAVLARYSSPPDAKGRFAHSLRWAGTAAAGLAVALLPTVVWHLLHPERVFQLLDYYSHNGYNEDVGAGPAAAVYWFITRLDVWWNTLNPERVLFVGDSDYRFSTRNVGYLLLPVGVLAIIGLIGLHRRLRPEFRIVLLAGLLLAPIPAVLAGSFEIKRWLLVLPFLALLATVGLQTLLETRRPIWRTTAGMLSIAAVLQFAWFLVDYHGDYRTRSSYTYGGNYRGVIEQLLATTDDPACAFVDERIARRAQWALYVGVSDRSAYADRQNIVDVERSEFSAPATCRRVSIAVLDERVRENQEFGERLASEGWIKIPVREPDDRVVYAVYRRSAPPG